MEILTAWKIVGLILVSWVTRITFAQNSNSSATSKQLCLPGNIYNNNLTLTGLNGTLQNPKLNYSIKMSCDWLITVPEGKIVKLVFDVFHLEPDDFPKECPRQYVEVLDGNNSSSKRRGRFCGYVNPGSIRSSGRYMWVRFRSDNLSSHHRRFEASFTAEDKSAASSKKLCFRGNIYNNNLTLTGLKGTLQNPMAGRGIYPIEMSCDWLISVPEGNIVKLIFDVFHLVYSRKCVRQYVEVLDGNNSFSTSRGRFCDYENLGSIRSSGRYMWVRFRSSNLSSFYVNVKATFTAEDKTICPYYSQVLTASASHNRTLTSPNYPMRYDKNARCKWILKVDSNLPSDDYIVRVTFSRDFKLEGFYGDCNDKLKFYDGNSTVSTLLGTYCETIRPDVLYSTGLDLYVEFDTDRRVTYKGFSFSFSAVNKGIIILSCRSSTWSDEVHMLNGSSGTFFTPNYPVPYPENISCIWVISVPAGKRVKLTFEDLNLFSTFTEDYIIMRDGQLQNSTELLRYYGEDVYYSSRSYMWIKFYSASRLWASEQRGFKARFEALDPPGNPKEFCFPGNIYNNNLKFTGLSGTLHSPEERYPSHLSCTWLITVPDGKIVRLTFHMFSLPERTPCLPDYVEVLDGKYSYSESKGRLCGYSTRPEDIRSSGRYMTVRFRTGPFKLFDGFRATFTAEDKPTVAATAATSKQLCLPGNINNKNLELTGSDGTLQSPLEYYPPDLNCVWLITVPEGNTVEFSFDRFDLDFPDNHGCKDYVQIRDGETSDHESLGRYCGDSVPEDIQSSSRYMLVRFYADLEAGPPRRGFKATFKAKSKPRNWVIPVAVTVGVVVMITLVCCAVCIKMTRKKQNTEAGDQVPMALIKTSASHPAQSEMTDPPLTVGYAPVPTNPEQNTPLISN
ncbi:bone morphogenetic protein 1-like [Oculina patagonica]